MGAQQAFHWAALFPDRIERIAPICGSAKTSAHNFVFLEQCIRAIIGTANLAGLIDSLSRRADPPGARRIVVAVELKSRHVVVGAPAPSDRQALAGLNIPDLVGAAPGRVDVPGARRIAVADELKNRHVVVGAPAPSDRQALTCLGVDEHHTLVVIG
jgi:pimeloyl-ACP methyl ester carboxylesterase